MKAVAVHPAKKTVGIVDQPEPKITSPTQVKLRMLDVGVCGTDREIVAFEYGTPPTGSDYLIIGHESLGEVVEVGSGVTGIAVGDLAVTMVRRPCDHADCVACRQHRADFCYTGDFTERGIKGRHGFMTEYVVDDAPYIVPVPANLRDVAVLTEPLTIAEKAMTQVYAIQDRMPWYGPVKPGEKRRYGSRAVVLGAGPVGLLGAMKLVLEGFDTFVYSREAMDSDKAKITQAIGATYICGADTSLDDLTKKVGNVDLVYEATGASRLAYHMMEELGINAVFCFTGVPGRKAPIEVDTDRIMRQQVLQNQVVFGTVNAGRPAYDAAANDLAHFVRAWPAAVRSLITSRRPIDEAPALLQSHWGGIKNVIQISG